MQNGNSTSSLSQPPQVISRAETITTKRASMGANRVKAETHDAKGMYNIGVHVNLD